MSKYTTELRYIIESGYDIGMKDYPVISEDYRNQLNQKIFNHFWFHEIGFETAERFKFYLNSTMNEIMVYYNKLLESELLIINPLLSFERNIESHKDSDTNVDEDINNSSTKNINNATNQNINNSTSLDNTTISSTDETQNRETDISQNSNINTQKNLDANNSNSDEDVFYDTPNGSLGDITDSTYATNVTKKTGSNIVDENETNNSIEDITKDEDVLTTIDSDTTNITNTDTNSDTVNETILDGNENNTNISDATKNTLYNETNIVTENGFELSQSELMLRYRETFLNVDVKIIDELKDLFMMVY